jgi:hypothetical protein
MSNQFKAVTIHCDTLDDLLVVLQEVLPNFGLHLTAAPKDDGSLRYLLSGRILSPGDTDKLLKSLNGGQSKAAQRYEVHPDIQVIEPELPRWRKLLRWLIK